MAMHNIIRNSSGKFSNIYQSHGLFLAPCLQGRKQNMFLSPCKNEYIMHSGHSYDDRKVQEQIPWRWFLTKSSASLKLHFGNS